MPLRHTVSEDSRYDAATLKKVTALAGRLQNESRESLSAHDIETIGSEVGLQPKFIRAALAQLEAEESSSATDAAGGWGSYVGIGIGSLLTSMVTYTATDHGWGRFPGMVLLWLILPLLLPTIVGAATRRSKLGLWFGLSLILTQIITGTLLTVGQGISADSGYWLAALMYAIIGGFLAGGMGWLAGWLRQRPKRRRRKSASPDREELLGTFMELQRRLEGPKIHRTILSIEVAGAAEQKRGEPTLMAEYSFSEFRRWVAGIVTAQGGELLPSITEGVLCMFPDGITAARAARQIQDSLQQFNESGNQLSRPFRVRCGIAGREVAAGSLQSSGGLQSWLVDPAISLQRAAEPGDILLGEGAAGSALVVLGSLARID